MLPVKLYRQKAGLCGVASLKMVLDYFGLQKSEAELEKLTGANAQKGTSLEDIKKAAQQFGFLVDIKDEADFGDIKFWLDKKVPLIVEGHYSVVIGLDKNYIYMQDPEIAKIRKIKRKDFKRVWFDFDGDFIRDKNNLILRRLIIIKPQ